MWATAVSCSTVLLLLLLSSAASTTQNGTMSTSNEFNSTDTNETTEDSNTTSATETGPTSSSTEASSASSMEESTISSSSETTSSASSTTTSSPTTTTDSQSTTTSSPTTTTDSQSTTTSSPATTTSSPSTLSRSSEIGAASSTNASTEDGRVRVEVYYSAYCRRSLFFIQTQLDPTVKRLRRFVKARLVPFGLANETQLSNGTWQFQCCPRSPINCLPDMIQTCAINLLNGTQNLEFITCLSRVPPWEVSRQMVFCANILNVNYTELQQCTTNQQGNRWFHEMAVLTSELNPPLTTTPWIVVNGMSNSTIQMKALMDLTRLVCELLPVPKPPECPIIVNIIPVRTGLRVLRKK